jgi:hypothetical protein
LFDFADRAGRSRAISLRSMLGIAVAHCLGQEAMTMKTNSMILAFVSALSLAGAARVANAQEGSAPKRGTVEVQAQAAKVVVAGPVAIHAYSGFSGAKVYVVAAVSGTDKDCAGARAGATTSLAADHVQTLSVAAGQLACVETTAAKGSELLWHVQNDRPAPSTTMLASSH